MEVSEVEHGRSDERGGTEDRKAEEARLDDGRYVRFDGRPPQSKDSGSQ